MVVLVVFGFKATLTAKVISWRTCVSWLSYTSTNITFFSKPPTTFLTCFSGGERRRKFASTGSRWLVVLGYSATLTLKVISWCLVTHMYILASLHQYNCLSKATNYFSHMLQQRWKAKIGWKESLPQLGIKLTTTRSWVGDAYNWATQAGHHGQQRYKMPLFPQSMAQCWLLQNCLEYWHLFSSEYWHDSVLKCRLFRASCMFVFNMSFLRRVALVLVMADVTRILQSGYVVFNTTFYTPVEDGTYYGITRGGRAASNSLSGAYLQNYTS